jgi:predicted porin
MRYGFDAQVNYKNLVFQGEYIFGKDDGSYTTGGGCGGEVSLVEGSVERSGYYLTALYKTKWNFEPVLKYEAYGIDNMDGAEVVDGKAMRLTAGFNYHFNEWTRLQVNYQYNTKESSYPFGTPYQDGLQIQLQAVIK